MSMSLHLSMRVTWVDANGVVKEWGDVSERSYPRDWIGLLPTEAARWVQAGLITEEQKAAIIELYPEPRAAGRDRTVLIFSILGSILVGAGVILFFASNWPRIAASVKVAAIMGAVLGSYAAGYYLQARTEYPRIGQALVLLGGLMYGAAIWLIAQIFHLETHYPNGFLLWAVGLLPVAWAARSLPVLYLSTGLLTIWTIMEQGEFGRFNYLYPLLTAGAVFPLARRHRSNLVEAAALGGLFLWFAINSVRLVSQETDIRGPFILAQLALLYGTAVISMGLARLGDSRVYFGVGSLLALGGTYLLTFEWPAWRYGDRVNLPPDPLWTAPPYVLIGSLLLLAVIAAGAWLTYQRGERLERILLALMLVPLLGALGVHMLAEVPRMIVFNLLLFGGTVGMIALGIQRRSELLLNMALAIFLIHVITRYFDLFFTAMDRSLFFVMGGLLLLGGGWLLERNRRRWLREWGGADHA